MVNSYANHYNVIDRGTYAEVTIFDTRDITFNASTVQDAARAVVAILSSRLKNPVNDERSVLYATAGITINELRQKVIESLETAGLGMHTPISAVVRITGSS